ncbi:MAG: MFS transporter [Thermodesulfobacteriota bacterium]|nr:MFS transporter [Thermodesulfobacteriota bacterium]
MLKLETSRTDVGAMKKSALIIATLNSFITPFMGSSINIALPAIEKEFHVDAVLLSWIATAYLLAVAVSLVPFGRFADIYGRKKVFTAGVILFTISSILCAASTSTLILLLFRVLQGIGNAMVFATGMAILVSVYPPQERGKVLGINVAAVYVGLSVGPFLGGILTSYFTWRSVFLVTVPFGLFILLLIFWKLKGEWADARGEEFDVLGSLIYATAIIGIILGISIFPDLKSLWVILAGVLCFFIFVKYELKLTHPVLEVRLFKTNRVFAFSSIAALINYSATFAVTFLLSLYLQHVKSLSPHFAGLVLVAQPIIMAVFSPFAGKLSDRIEPRNVATFGMALTTIGLFLMTFLNIGTSLGYIMCSLILLGFGFALFSSPNTNAIMSSVEKRFFGIASGTVGTMRTLGMMVSMAIATLVFSIFIGRVQISPEKYPLLIKSISVAFIIFSILCFLGIFLSMTRGNLRSNKD